MSARDKIKIQINKVSEDKQKFKASDLAQSLKDTSRQYITEVLRQMVSNGELLREGGGRYTVYTLPKYAELLTNRIKKRLPNKSLDEDQILDEMKSGANFLNNLKDNVSRIFNYAFTEMVNNAIEHSKSENIEVEVYKSGNNLIFVVNDFGIGVFKNVMKTKKLASELEAMQEILKGKTTTIPANHSGEGIFFTSRVSDVFILESYGLKLRVDNLIDDIFYEEEKSNKVGTKVTFIVALDSDRLTDGVFLKYQTDPEEGGFDKTEIRVKLFAGGSIYVSRSQARRIMDGLAGKFKTITLDYDKVPTIGQAFADEIYRVFKSKHAEIDIKSVNMNRVVEFMINRVSPE
jgi:anti-sigma regulatory factor (Ser/Thr protein kinase)